VHEKDGNSGDALQLMFLRQHFSLSLEKSSKEEWLKLPPLRSGKFNHSSWPQFPSLFPNLSMHAVISVQTVGLFLLNCSCVQEQKEGSFSLNHFLFHYTLDPGSANWRIGAKELTGLQYEPFLRRSPAFRCNHCIAASTPSALSSKQANGGTGLSQG